MKRRTDTQAQQARIRVEHEARKATEAAWAARSDRARLRAKAPYYATLAGGYLAPENNADLAERH